MYRWTIYFYDRGGHRHQTIVMADNFDDALAIARKEDSRYAGGFRQPSFITEV